jgi:2-dehydro-3-deoxyglucarate aldolase
MTQLKSNSLKKKLADNCLTIGSWLSLPLPDTADMMARAGFEWLVVDLEHGDIEIETLQAMFVAIERHGCIPLAHLPSNGLTQTKRVLDAGAYGVIVPSVKNATEAKGVVQSVKYPPWGTRNVSLVRAQGYGSKVDEYNEVFNEESIVIIQIDHKEAVENIDEILSEKGIDGIFINLIDVSGSYGNPGQLDHPLVKKAEQMVKSACERHQIPVGFHVISPEKDHLESRIQEGFRLIAYGVDTLYLNQACRKGVQEVSEFLSQEKSETVN